MAKKKCSKCGKMSGLLSGLLFVQIKYEDFCGDCAKEYFDEKIKDVVITTTNNIDGHKVKRYIDIASVEVVIGTGVFSEFGGEISDFFGARSSGFEKKLQDAKIAGFKKLKFVAAEKEGNAVIGIDIDYTEFSGNRIGVVVNGTVVEIEEV